MKRQVKFRGKRIDTGEWIYGNLHIPNKLFSTDMICPDTTFGDMAPGMEDGEDYEEVKKHGCSIGHYHRVISDTVGEYTGLKDKNGIEIFEGDVLRLQYPLNYGYAGIHNKEIIVIISFEDGCFWFKGDGYTDCNWHFYNEYEVIGNIHETFDLFK